MYASSSSVNLSRLSPLFHADNKGERRPTRFNLYDPEVRSASWFNVLPEVYFSGSENLQGFLEVIDNHIRLLEIPRDLSDAYLKGHLLGRAQDWYQIFGPALVQNTATDFAQLKAALSKAFPAIRNKKDLEIKFYASQQRRDQEPTDFVYDTLKLNKKTKTGDVIPDSQIDTVTKTIEERKVEIDLSKTRLKKKQKQELRDLFNSFQGLFSDKPGLTHVLYHEIYTGDKPPVVSRPYRYDRVKQAILDYHIDKMLKEGTIIPIQSPNALPVVLCRKKNGLPPNNPEAYRFAVDYRKLNAITKYRRYSLIDDLIMNIPHTTMMSALNLRSGYFQLALNHSDIVKTTFVTTNDTYTFRRMPFGLSGAAPNFQKAIDIILKTVIGKFVNVYMDGVIISSPSFTQHIEHLREIFRLLEDAELTLNKDKCKFGCDELKYLGLIINKEGIKTDEAKVRAIVEMKPPRNSKEVSKFLEAQKPFDAVKAAITKAPVLKMSDFKKPFELFTDASSIGLGAVLNQEQRPVVFASRTLSNAERNYTVTNRECLAVVWALNKSRTYLGSLPIKVIMDHAALMRLRQAVNETTGKTPAELFLGQKLITPFQKLVMVSDGTKFAVGDIERLFDEARQNTKAKQEKWAKYYNRHRRDVQIKVNDWVLIITHSLSSATTKVVAKFKPKFEGPHRVLEVKNNSTVIWRSGKRLTVNVDQVRIYRHRRCDEMEIRTGSSDSTSSRHESSSFESVQRRSNESQYGRKKRSGVKRELLEKGISFLRKIRVIDTQVRPIIMDHLSDHHLALGLNPVERLKGKIRPNRRNSNAATTSDKQMEEEWSPDQPGR
ncbi:retrovirus-related Pol polyprotein from transposon 297 [Trichonephila clavipes]|nr:retrovirus-related Pol polyprotein from transposon 297 [Trichonephila clavipes]